MTIKQIVAYNPSYFAISPEEERNRKMNNDTMSKKLTKKEKRTLARKVELFLKDFCIKVSDAEFKNMVETFETPEDFYKFRQKKIRECL